MPVNRRETPDRLSRISAMKLLPLIALAMATQAPNSRGQAAHPGPNVQIGLGAEAIQVEYVTDGIRKGELLLRLSHGEVKAELGWDKNNRILRFEATRGELSAADSHVSIEQKSGLLRLLLGRLFQTADLPDAFTFLINYVSELNARLAEASAWAKAWNKTIGRPYSGGTNRFVKDLMNEQHLYTDLEKVFNEVGYSMTVSAVENVIVEEIRYLKDPEFMSLREKVGPQAKLPTTASLYFAVKRDR